MPMPMPMPMPADEPNIAIGLEGTFTFCLRSYPRRNRITEAAKLHPTAQSAQRLCPVCSSAVCGAEIWLRFYPGEPIHPGLLRLSPTDSGERSRQYKSAAISSALSDLLIPLGVSKHTVTFTAEQHSLTASSFKCLGVLVELLCPGPGPGPGPASHESELRIISNQSPSPMSPMSPTSPRDLNLRIRLQVPPAALI